jgi:hypothetical protein
MLLVRGEWDVDASREMALGLWGNLTSAQSKRWVEISSATNALPLQANRMALFRVALSFLEEPLPLARSPQPSFDFLAAQLAEARAAEQEGPDYEAQYHAAVGIAVVFGATALIAIVFACRVKHGNKFSPPSQNL